MKKNAYVYFPKAVFSEIDAIAPLLLELCKLDGKVITVVFNARITPTIENSYLHKKIFYELCEFCDFSLKNIYRSRFFNSINQLISLAKFIALLVSIGIKYQNKFVLIDWPKRGKNQAFKHRVLHKIILFTVRCIGAKVYSFPGIQAPHTEAFLERTSAEGAKKSLDLKKDWKEKK